MNIKESSQDNSEKNVFQALFPELKKVKDNQRSLVLITHGFIELLLNSIIDNKCKLGKKKITASSRDYPHSVKLVLLYELNYIDKQLYQILDRFRKVRNEAAHEPLFQIKEADSSFFNQSLERFIAGESKRKPNNLYHFCILLIGTIWNENLDIFMPKFLPNMVKEE